EGSADRFITHQALRDALLITHLRRQGQRPHPCGLAVEARRLMQEMLEAFTLGSVQHRFDRLWTVRLLLQARHTLDVKGTNDITNSLDGAPDQLRNGLRGQPLGTRQDDLGPPDTEGVRGASVSFQLHTLIIGQGSNKERWFHSPSIPRELQLHKNSCGD